MPKPRNKTSIIARGIKYSKGDTRDYPVNCAVLIDDITQTAVIKDVSGHERVSLDDKGVAGKINTKSQNTEPSERPGAAICYPYIQWHALNLADYKVDCVEAWRDMHLTNWGKEV